MNLVLVRQGPKYDKEYVQMLINMGREFAKEPITLTDQLDTPGKTRPLQSNLKGWWSKMELFAPWNEDLRPCVFIDLDTYILKPIHDLFFNPDALWLIRDFYNPDRSNSGVMVIPKKIDIWGKDFNGFQGDGDFLNTLPHKVLQDKFDGITSYKVHNTPSRIVCFHGRPKPHATTDWARDIWLTWTKPS